MQEETNVAIMNISETINRHELKGSSKMPLKLAVDIEVEACEETEDVHKNWFHTDSDSVPSKRPCLSKPNEDKNPPSLDIAAYLDTDNVINVAEEIIKKADNSVNVSIAIAVRNYWGKVIKKPHIMSELDKQINSILESWKTKETILTYKCYICVQAWWYLNPFKEHVQKHENVEILLEKYHNVANIVAYEKNIEKTAQPIHAFGDCFRCNKSFNRHIDMNGKYMKCYMGDQRSSLMEKKEKCRICRYNGNPDEHYVTCHSVRSDVPIDTKVGRCKSCDEYYYGYNLHECKSKRTSFLCYSCHRYFIVSQLQRMHLEIVDKPYKCPYCNGVLPKQCAEPFHLLKHTSDFMTVDLCTICRGNLVFFSVLALTTHMLNKHNGFHSKVKRFTVSRCVYLFFYFENYSRLAYDLYNREW